jgi:hypothetical protein
MIRDTCGSVAGILAHQAAGEPLCGWCSYAEQAHRIAAEGIPARPAAAAAIAARPVSAEDAAMHLAVLQREVIRFDRAHQGWYWRSGKARSGRRSAA